MQAELELVVSATASCSGRPRPAAGAPAAPPSASRPTPATPPIRKARRWNTALPLVDLVEEDRRFVSSEPHVGVLDTARSGDGRRETARRSTRNCQTDRRAGSARCRRAHGDRTKPTPKASGGRPRRTSAHRTPKLLAGQDQPRTASTDRIGRQQAQRPQAQRRRPRAGPGTGPGPASANGASIEGRITAQAKAGAMGNTGSGSCRPKTRIGSGQQQGRETQISAGTPASARGRAAEPQRRRSGESWAAAGCASVASGLAAAARRRPGRRPPLRGRRRRRAAAGGGGGAGRGGRAGRAAVVAARQVVGARAGSVELAEKSLNSRIRTKSIGAASESSATRQAPSRPLHRRRPPAGRAEAPRRRRRSGSGRPSCTGSCAAQIGQLGIGRRRRRSGWRGALVRATSTGVRLSTSVSSRTRLAPSATPTTRPTRPCSLITGLPIDDARARRRRRPGGCWRRGRARRAIDAGGDHGHRRIGLHAQQGAVAGVHVRAGRWPGRASRCSSASSRAQLAVLATPAKK